MSRLASDITPVTALNLAQFPMFSHGFFGRRGGVSEGVYDSLNTNPASLDDPLHVMENRKRVTQFLGARPAHLLTCQQVHGAHVVKVKTPWDVKDRPDADALVTSFGGLALGILTADCVPVLFADNKAGVIGAAHAGWKGARGGVIARTLDAMADLGAKIHDIHVAIGPCIWQDSYEVTQDFLNPFLEENSDNIKFFIKSSRRVGSYQFDLPGYVYEKILRLSVASVTPSMADTCAQETRFFSYRRATLAGQPETGRQISCIMIAS